MDEMARLSSSGAMDIVIPVYNEAENILSTLATLDRHVKTNHRILICYDFDKDTTLEALKQYRHGGKVVLVKNKGSGPHDAVMTGLKESVAEAVLVFPADDVLNAPIIDVLYRQIRDGCDIAAPCRFMPGGEMTHCPWFKALLVRGASWSLHWLAGLPIRDASNGFRMFSRRALQTIPVESTVGFTYSLELTAKCHRLGWRMAEVPARWRERSKGSSRFKVFAWLLPYLRWYAYIFATTWLFRRTVKGATAHANGEGMAPKPESKQ